MESKITVQRDGMGVVLNTRELVPGDVIMLVGGVNVPADVHWIEGDVLVVDMAAVTGENLPIKFPSKKAGNFIPCGCTINSGEAYALVHATGLNTEDGQNQKVIMEDKAGGKPTSEFEMKVLRAMSAIITCSVVVSLVIFLLQGIKEHEFEGGMIRKDLLTCLSIIVAAIPIALPIVMNVTMSLGSAKMAKEFSAVVTSIPALQDIASMSVLCSDKTGTLTTAKMQIHHDEVWCNESFVKKEICMYAMLGSSRDKKEDAVDRCVVKYFDSVFKKPPADFELYQKTGGMGFNPVYKRVVVDLTHPKLGKIRVAKGLAVKLLDTENGGKDDAVEQWKCHDYEKLMPIVNEVDKDFASRGFKTIGVAVKHEDKPWVFCGILPMIDPPRHDSAVTIQNLNNAGIRVKMITGDHLNIGIETCKQIKMGSNLFPGEMTRSGTRESKQAILDADGFAQVLPKDKREVVKVLREDFGLVVGMTGDGVNDAPALSAAQCGIAVEDATDAANGAAAIILTTPGLSAIYAAVVESRRIFRKLKSYVVYRFAASIQIVTVLSMLVFASNCAVDPTYIIMLALLNDLTMLPIAYDVQCASKIPEVADVNKILTSSLCIGLLESFFSLLFAYAAGPSELFQSPMAMAQCPNTEPNPDDAPATSLSIQSAIFIQMFISAELLIFSARAPSHFLLFAAPSPWLIATVLGGCILMCILVVNVDYFGGLYARDVVAIWIYDIIVLCIVDLAKVKLFRFLGENMETLPDDPILVTAPLEDEEDVVDTSGVAEVAVDGERLSMRLSATADRMTERAIQTNERLSQLDRNSARESLMRASQTGKSGASTRDSRNRKDSSDTSRVSITASGVISSPNDSQLRGSFLNMGGSLRPNTPANKAATKKR
jgi:H+-transporting ATPase